MRVYAIIITIVAVLGWGLAYLFYTQPIRTQIDTRKGIKKIERNADDVAEFGREKFREAVQ